MHSRRGLKALVEIQSLTEEESACSRLPADVIARAGLLVRPHREFAHLVVVALELVRRAPWVDAIRFPLEFMPVSLARLQHLLYGGATGENPGTGVALRLHADLR